MRKCLYAIIIITGLLATVSIAAEEGLSISVEGATGVYLMPGEIHGFISGSAPTDNRYIWTESDKTNEYGYIEKTYKFKHPFPERTLPNAGFFGSLSYRFQGGFGVFIEGGQTFSLLDKEIGQTVSDTLPADAYSVIPHDFQIRRTESNDRLYMKSLQFGLGVSYAVPLRKNTTLIIAGSIGTVSYSQHFRIETKSIQNTFFQNNGNLVYTATDNQGSFEVFGIRYTANCFKPSVALEWKLRPPLSAHIGLGCPIALIEKGIHFTESNYYSDYASIYYPSKRFWTGNISLNAGIRLHFKGTRP